LDGSILPARQGAGDSRNAPVCLRTRADIHVLNIGFIDIARVILGFDVVVDKHVLLPGDFRAVLLGAIGSRQNVRRHGRIGLFGHGGALPVVHLAAARVGFVLGRSDWIRAILVRAPFERHRGQAAHIINISPYLEIARLGRCAPFHSAWIVRFALRDKDARGRVILRSGDDQISKLNRLIAGARHIAVPRLAAAIPIPIVARLSAEKEMPGLFRIRACAGEDIRHARIGRNVVRMEHAIARGGHYRPAVAVRTPAARIRIAQPLFELRIAVVRPSPRAVLDVDHIVRRHGELLEIILDRRAFVIGVAAVPGNHVLEIRVIIRIRAAAIVVAVVMQDHKHRMGGVGIVGQIGIHYCGIQECAISAAPVFVAFVAGGRDGDHFRDRAGFRVHILHIMRLVAKGRADFARRPDVLQLHPCAALRGRVGVDLIRRIGREEIRCVCVRIIDAGAVEMDVIHHHPIEAFGGQGGNHAFRKGIFRREHAFGVGAARPGLVVDLLVETDLHLHVAAVEKWHQRMMIAKCHEIEPRIVERGFQAQRLEIAGAPVVPHPAVGACGLQCVKVFD